MSDRLDWLNTYKEKLFLNHRNTTIMTVECQGGVFSNQGEWFEDRDLESFYQGFITCKSMAFSEQVSKQRKSTAMDIHVLRHQLEFGDGCEEYQGL